MPTQHVISACLEGLQHLHCCHRIVHGEVRASNVLLGPGAAVRLVDFGLNDVLHWRRPAEARTAHSRAPELWSEEPTGPTCSEAADVWALGCLVVIMMVGYEVSAEACRLAMDSTHLRFLAKHLPPPACDMVYKCVRKAPSHRSSVEKLLKDSWISCSLSDG